MGGSKSLGYVALGGSQLQGLDFHTFCIIGDGEAEEGQIYEAASNADLLGADNLTWILNRNKAQQTAGTQDVSSLHFEDIFKGLGWNVVVLSGESAEPAKNRDFITKLRAALLDAKKGAHNAGRPTVIIADTIKGKGVDFMEYKGQKPGDYKFHGTAPTSEQLAQALPLIEARLGTPDLESLTTFMKEAAISSSPQKTSGRFEHPAGQEDAEQTQMEIRQSAQVSFPDYKPTDKPNGTRVGFGGALTYLAAKHPEVVATSPDLQDSVHMFDMEKITRRHGKGNPLGAYFPEGICRCQRRRKCRTRIRGPYSLVGV